MGLAWRARGVVTISGATYMVTNMAKKNKAAAIWLLAKRNA